MAQMGEKKKMMAKGITFDNLMAKRVMNSWNYRYLPHSQNPIQIQWFLIVLVHQKKTIYAGSSFKKKFKNLSSFTKKIPLKIVQNDNMDSIPCRLVHHTCPTFWTCVKHRTLTQGMIKKRKSTRQNDPVLMWIWPRKKK